MREFAKRPHSDRRELFRECSQLMQIHEAIVEKDFWVCWVLDYLFCESPWKSDLVFKGGTSLSKAYGAIQRFSEDIDLVLDWRRLGYSAGEPWEVRSNTQQDRFGKEAIRQTAQFLEQTFVPRMKADLALRAASELQVTAEDQNVLLTYPKTLSLDAIQPQIRLEIGPLAEPVPNGQKQIRPFVVSKFPEFFKQHEATVTTVTAERTFWEKATILHQEAHRDAASKLPARYARHYYDLCQLSKLPIRASALQKVSLLEDVVRFKMKFYRCPWAKFEEAIPGTLKLLPSELHVHELKRDYRSMQSMLYGAIPAFEDIVDELENLQIAINQIGIER